MHPKLSKPPVKYVLAQVRFTSIENIEEYISSLQDNIRDIFPYFQKLDFQGINLRQGQQPTVSMLAQWHFFDIHKTTGIIIDKQSITIHTSFHEDFTSLLNKFKDIMEKVDQILKISIFTRLGLRYINLIEDGLSKVDAALLGFRLTGNEFLENHVFTKTQTTQVSRIGLLNVIATCVRGQQTISNVKNIFVPPELANGASILSFKHHTEPKKDFLLLDIDHSYGKEGKFEISKILKHFTDLHQVLYHAFCKAAGQENLKNWE